MSRRPRLAPPRDGLASPRRAAVPLTVLAFVLACVGCGGGEGRTGTPPPPPVNPGEGRTSTPPPPPVNPACVAPKGTAVQFEVRRIDPRSPPPARDAGSPPGGSRVVHLRHQGSGARVSWVVETATEVVVGFYSPPYCSGVTPSEEQFDVVLPASTKPARVQECGGSCSGPPLP